MRPQSLLRKRIWQAYFLPLNHSQRTESNYSEATLMESLPTSSTEKSTQQKQFTSSHSEWELTEEETEEQDGISSVALQSSNKGECFQSQKLWQGNNQERRSWHRTSLNYSHLIALALRNSPPCGLNVQDIYSFTQQHFPFFWTAPNGWRTLFTTSASWAALRRHQ